MDGIPGTCGGTGMSRTSVQIGVRGLRKLGVISIDEPVSGNAYIVNTNWSADMLRVPKDKKDRPSGLKLSKRRPKNWSLNDQKVIIGGPKTDHHKNITYKEENSLIGRAPEASVADAVEQAQERNRSRRNSKISSTKKKGVNATVADLELVWRSAIEQNELYAFRSYSPWTMKEKGMMKNFMKSLTLKGGSLADYLEWVVDTWHTIAAARFAQGVRSSLIGGRCALLATGLIRDCQTFSRAGLCCCQ